MLRLARIALSRPLPVLALLAVATAAAGLGLFRLELRTDGAAIYPRGDPAVERTLVDRQVFQEADQIVLLATSRRGGPRLDSPAGCRFLVWLQHALARFPGVELAGVRSAVTLIDPPRTLAPLRIQTFFEEWSGGQAPLADVLARMRRLPITGGLFLSADGTAAAFYVPVGERTSRTVLLADLRRFLAARAGAPFLMRLTGPVAAEVELGEEVVRDLARLVPVMVAAVALLLALWLRTAGGVLIPLAQVMATLVWTLGLMGWAGVPVTLVTTVLPVLLMAMAMTDEIYLLERLQDHLAAAPAADGAAVASGIAASGAVVAGSAAPAAVGGSAAPEAAVAGSAAPAAARSGSVGSAARERDGQRRRVRLAAECAFADLVAPLVLISLSTAAGFFSFLGASMAPLRHLGLFTGIGLLLAMLFTFTLAPALMAALPSSWLERRRPPGRRLRRSPAGAVSTPATSPASGGATSPAPAPAAAVPGMAAAGNSPGVVAASNVPGLAAAGDSPGLAAAGDSPGLAAARNGRGLPPFERLTARRPRAVALAAIGLLAAAAPGLARLRVEDAWIDNFDPRSPLVTAARRFDAEFWGSYRFDVVCAGGAGYSWTPQAAALLEELGRWAARAPQAGGMVSVLPAFEAGARALDLPLPLSALPQRDMRRVGMLVEVLRLRLYLRDLLTLDGDRLRARLLVPNADYGKARELAAAFAAELPRLAAGRPIEVHASGEVPVALAVVGAIVGNQLRSIGWTAVLIGAMLLAALRRPRWAAAVMAPVAAATLLLFGGLGWAGVPLGVATSMFAALNLGAGVDFAVQYVYAYRRERRPRMGHPEAVAATLRTTGRGLRCNALVLALGIAVLALSSIKPNRSLGLLLALAILVSYAATLAMLPELLRNLAAAPVPPPALSTEGGVEAPGLVLPSAAAPEDPP
jgi:predicted RND superfamily exporter protein